MLARIAAFEFRYQVTSPLFIAAATLFFGAAFFDMAVVKLVSEPGGTVLSNAPHSIIKLHLLAALLLPFVGAAFVANVILRDDLTGFGPLILATPVRKRDYLLGRFLGASAIGALILAAASLGMWLGTLMPFADQAKLGPNGIAAYAYGLGVFALPDALIVFAILFALTTITRSTAGTFVGVILLLTCYLVGQRLIEGHADFDTLRVLVDPFGMSAYMAASRYLTAAELNAGVVPVSDLMLLSRLVWTGVAILLIAATVRLFRFTARRPSRRQERRLARRRAAQPDAPTTMPQPMRMPRLPAPRFDRRTAIVQLLARMKLEARFIVRSPAYWIMLAIAFVFALPGLMLAAGIAGTPLYPLTSVYVPILRASFWTLLIVIATYHGGELVWRERERRIDPIIDAAPLPAITLLLPKLLGLALVLVSTLAVSAGVAILLQLIDGSAAVVPLDYLRWYLLPVGIDALVTAALAIFVQVLSPGKYAGWGIMAVYIVLLLFGPSLGLVHPILLYGAVPDAPLSDMAGTGFAGQAGWWLRLFWATAAALLLVAAHHVWPRGIAQPLRVRLRRARLGLTGAERLAIGALSLVLLLSGGWIVANTMIFNPLTTPQSTQRYLAAYERRYLLFARLPQPVVEHVGLAVALYPDRGSAEARGRYRLANRTAMPIDQVHVRLADPGLTLVGLAFPGARLARDDRAFGYRIYRLDRPMRPGEVRTLSFGTRRARRGFSLSGGTQGVLPDGTELDAFELTPRIGMHDGGLIEDPAARRELGLPPRPPLPVLEDAAANRRLLSDNAWITADITVSTSVDQRGIAPGRLVEDRILRGRRISRFVSDRPIQNNFSIQSGRFAVARAARDGVDYAIYHHPAHPWNIARMLHAMQESIGYFSRAFGPYQFDQARIVETAYREGAHAYPNTIAMGESVFALDQRNPHQLDMVTMFAAHELSHQWWGHQLRGTRMEGTAVLVETLAQYSALMVAKRMRGGAGIDDYLAFQLDRYLKGRRASATGEPPLVRAGTSDQHIAYGKGALAMYLLQERLGEQAVNRALRRFVARHRFSAPPYPRSTDLVAELRAEATTAEQQALITDLFERVTLYDLRLGQPAAMRRPDGRWNVTVPIEARKYHADRAGREREQPLLDLIDVSLSAADGGALLATRVKLHSGKQRVHLVTRERPDAAALDPRGLYIDRNRADNLARLTEAATP